MFSSLVILASASLATAWPAVFYSDVNCTSVVAAYSHISEDVCIDTNGVQSYSGSLGSEKQELLIHIRKEECNPKAIPAAAIDGTPQSCIFIYKSLVGPFAAARVAPVQPPAPRLSQQD